MRHWNWLLVMALVAPGGCSGADTEEGGLGDLAPIDISLAERAEIRRVVAPDSIAGLADQDDSVELHTPFGEFAVPVGTVSGEELGGIVEAIGEAHYIDTGTTTYDLPNPDFEAIFFEGDEELARLGYYVTLGSWGEYEVPGRWIDDQWRLLALTNELRSESLGQ